MTLGSIVLVYIVYMCALMQMITGPSHWGSKYKQCVGKHQSPIDITEQDVETVHLQPLNFRNFGIRPKFYNLENNGHTGEYKLF